MLFTQAGLEELIGKAASPHHLPGRGALPIGERALKREDSVLNEQSIVRKHPKAIDSLRPLWKLAQFVEQSWVVCSCQFEDKPDGLRHAGRGVIHAGSPSDAAPCVPIDIA